MNIVPIQGSVARLEEPGVLQFVLPVVFERINTGPPGLLQFTIESRDAARAVEGPASGEETTSLRLEGEQTVHQYSSDHSLQPGVGAIKSRPLHFKDEGSGNGIVAFAFSAAPATGAARFQAQVALNTTFTNLAFLSIPIDLEVNAGSGKLESGLSGPTRCAATTESRSHARKVLTAGAAVGCGSPPRITAPRACHSAPQPPLMVRRLRR